jgi:hypothetical protein
LCHQLLVLAVLYVMLLLAMLLLLLLNGVSFSATAVTRNRSI